MNICKNCAHFCEENRSRMRGSNTTEHWTEYKCKSPGTKLAEQIDPVHGGKSYVTPRGKIVFDQRPDCRDANGDGKCKHYEEATA